MSQISLKLPTVRLPVLAVQTKVAILSIAFGVTIIGCLAKYLRRRRRTKPCQDAPVEKTATKIKRHFSRGSITLKSPNGDIPRLRRSTSPSIKPRSASSSTLGAGSTVSRISNTVVESEIVTPHHLCQLGLESLDAAINNWEQAISAIAAQAGGQLALTDKAESQFHHHLEMILDRAYKLQDECERLFLNQNSVLFKTDSVLTLDTIRFDLDRRTTLTRSSSESFVSASDLADLRDFEDDAEPDEDSLKDLVLFQAALTKLQQGFIHCRCLRTDRLKCRTDEEFLAKLYCIRLAFQHVFENEEIGGWLAESGKKLISDLIVCADKDPKEFQNAFESMINYVQDGNNWPCIEEELRGRGIPVMSFYDIVLDFILLDAFDDLESPPSSVTAVIQNRWLTTGFKETALNTTVWSVLKAKRRLLKFPDGFIAHFYNISQHVSPVLAWGFLGNCEDMKNVCFHFRDQVMGFMIDIFSFEKARYTSVEALAEDIVRVAHQRVDLTQNGFTLSNDLEI